MEVIVLHKNPEELIRLCRQQNPKAQKLLYEMYAPKLLSICRRYTNDISTAEGIMLSAFLKIFNNLNAYRSEGCFDAWVSRIAVNQSIDYVRKYRILHFTESVEPEHVHCVQEESNGYVDEIQEMIDRLPEGARLVFTLFVIEGYKHAEIADMLDISVGTSKSQLAYARNTLQKMILKHPNAAI